MHIVMSVFMFGILGTLGIAVGQFAMGTFSSVSNMAFVDIKQVKIFDDGSGSIVIMNRGSTEESVIAIYAAGSEFSIKEHSPTVLPSNTETVIHFQDKSGHYVKYDVGQKTTLQVKLADGILLTSSIVEAKP